MELKEYIKELKENFKKYKIITSLEECKWKNKTLKSFFATLKDENNRNICKFEFKEIKSIKEIEKQYIKNMLMLPPF